MVSNRRTTQDHMRKLGPVVPKSSILRSHDTRIIGGRREARARAGGKAGARLVLGQSGCKHRSQSLAVVPQLTRTRPRSFLTITFITWRFGGGESNR